MSAVSLIKGRPGTKLQCSVCLYLSASMASGEVRGVWFGVRSMVSVLFSDTVRPAASKTSTKRLPSSSQGLPLPQRQNACFVGVAHTDKWYAQPCVLTIDPQRTRNHPRKRPCHYDKMVIDALIAAFFIVPCEHGCTLSVFFADSRGHGRGKPRRSTKTAATTVYSRPVTAFCGYCREFGHGHVHCHVHGKVRGNARRSIRGNIRGNVRGNARRSIRGSMSAALSAAMSMAMSMAQCPRPCPWSSAVVLGNQCRNRPI